MGKVGSTPGLMQQLRQAKRMQGEGVKSPGVQNTPFGFGGVGKAIKSPRVQNTPFDVLGRMGGNPEAAGFGGVGKALGQMTRRGKMGSGSIGAQGMQPPGALESTSERIKAILDAKKKPPIK